MTNIKLLFTIIDAGSSKKIKHLLNRFGIRIKTVTNASGTASSNILNYLGLAETKKEIFMAVVPDDLSSKILNKINSEFNLAKAGTGISFTIPISSANKYLSESFIDNNSNRGESNMKNKISIEYHLIITIVSEGYLEQVMAAAKRAGSSGGTAIKGRGLSDLKHVKILGFNIQPEKDIVLNIVSEKDKTKVMEEITKEVGIKTRGKGVCISLPIDDVVGLSSITL